MLFSALPASFKANSLLKLQAAPATPDFAHIGPFGQGASAVPSVGELEASNAAFLRHYNAKVESYKVELSILGQMRQRIDEVGASADALNAAAGSGNIQEAKKALQQFVALYNAWDADFDEHFEKGALLEENQAAGYARFALQREVGSLFHGAGNGGVAQGLRDIGVGVGPSGQLSFDEAVFDAVTTRQPGEVLQTLLNMTEKVAETAAMINAPGHLMGNRLGRLNDAVVWAAGHQPALEAEFGPGAATEQALTAYKVASSF